MNDPNSEVFTSCKSLQDYIIIGRKWWKSCASSQTI